MKTLRLLLAALAFAPLAALAQNQNVTQAIATKRVNSDIVIPSGKSVTIESGGSLTANTGATVTIAGVAPGDATYITKTSSSGLTAETPLSALATGLVQVTTTSGELSSVTTSAGVSGLLSDETGTGSLVFSNSPALVTPTLGVATATSINKLAFTAPATAATLTIADGKTFTASNTLTFTGTDSTSFAFPSSSGTVATLAGAQTFSDKTFTAPVIDQGVFTEAAAPSTPSSGRVALYAKTDGLLYSKDDAGAETLVSGGSGGGGGSIGGSSGATDNAIVRADGTGGSTVQSSLLTIDDAGAVTVPEIAAPSTPASGKVVFYAKADGLLYSKDDAGTETALGLSGAGTGDVVGPASATDEALARFDSTTGKLIQNGAITASDAGALTVPEIAAPSTPASAKVALYAKSDGLLYSKDDAGTETLVSGGAGGGGGTALFVGSSAKTATYTIVAGDKGYLIDCTSGTFTATLDAAATLGAGFFVGIANTGTGTITLATTSSEIIRGPRGGVTSLSMGRGQSYILFCDGTKFIVTANAGVTGPTSSINGRLVLWDSSSGGMIRDSSTITASGDDLNFANTAQIIAGTGNVSLVPASAGSVVSTGKYTFRSGGSSVYPSVTGVAYSHLTAVGNVGTGEDTLMTRTTGSSMLSADGMRFRLRATFTLAANGNNKQIRAKFGGTTYYDSTAVAANGGSVVIDVLITRTGASTQNISATVISSNPTFPSTAVVTTAAETSSSGNAIAFTGEATADNDISQREMLIEYFPAP